MKEINNSAAANKTVYRQLEQVVGCKWSVAVLKSIQTHVTRPGQLERHIDGISKKVLSERLRKLTEYGLLHKHVFAEVPPRTEYALTEYGEQLISIIDQIRGLDTQIKSATQKSSVIGRNPRVAAAPAQRSGKVK